MKSGKNLFYNKESASKLKDRRWDNERVVEPVQVKEESTMRYLRQTTSVTQEKSVILWRASK